MTDKGSFETYEYTEGNEDDQFFLVQDDGSFLSCKYRTDNIKNLVGDTFFPLKLIVILIGTK